MKAERIRETRRRNANTSQSPSNTIICPGEPEVKRRDCA